MEGRADEVASRLAGEWKSERSEGGREGGQAGEQQDRRAYNLCFQSSFSRIENTADVMKQTVL